MLSAHQRDRPGYGRAARHRVLPYAGFVILAVVAAAGWSLSFTKLHTFGVELLEFGVRLAWLVPVVFDLAPVGLSIVVYRAKLQARSAVVWRAGIWAFCGISSWINWMTLAGNPLAAQVIGAILPIAAVVLFEGMMHETHKAAQADLYEGAIVPRLTLACWVLDRRRTFRAFKTKTLRPLAAAETALGLTGEATPGPLPNGLAGLQVDTVGTPVHATTIPPGHEGGHRPVSTPVQTGRDQERHDLVTAPGEPGGQLVAYDPLTMGPDAMRDQGADTRTRVIAAHGDHPEDSNRDLADRLGVSLSTVKRYRPRSTVNGHDLR